MTGAPCSITPIFSPHDLAVLGYGDADRPQSIESLGALFIKMERLLVACGRFARVERLYFALCCLSSLRGPHRLRYGHYRSCWSST